MVGSNVNSQDDDYNHHESEEEGHPSPGGEDDLMFNPDDDMETLNDKLRQSKMA